MLMAAAAGDQTAPTKDNLLDQMYTNQATLKGWDVVHNMMEDPVNRFIKAQYDARTGGQDMPISVGFCQVFPNPAGNDSTDSQVAAYARGGLGRLDGRPLDECPERELIDDLL